MSDDIRAVLLDLDGVLVDTTALHERVWAEFFERERLPVPAGGIRSLFGRPATEALAELLDLPPSSPQVLGGLEWLEQRVEEVAVDEHPDGLLVPGVEATVRSLAGHYRLAVATSARRHVAEARLAPLREVFGAVVTADEVERGKPDPEIYLAAAAGVGVDPDRCVVVEDAVLGVRAGRAAGAVVVGVLGTVPDRLLRDAGAATVIPDVTHLPGVLADMEGGGGHG